MSNLSADNRAVVASALHTNLAIATYLSNLRGAVNSEQHPILSVLNEMVQVAQLPYDQNSMFFKGDTLDRHPWSCYGNLNEVIVMMSHWSLWSPMDHTTSSFERSIEGQVSSKIDLTIDDVTYQVKTAAYGTGGQLFVAHEDLAGDAQFLVYVSTKDRWLIFIDRATFAKRMRTVYEVIGPVERWWGRPGWFITPGTDFELAACQRIPAGIAVCHYDSSTEQMSITI